MTPFSRIVPFASCTALAVVSSVRGLASPTGLRSRIISISQHGGTPALNFSQVMTREEALAGVQAELMDTLMEDQSIGDTIKDILKKALSSVVGTLSEVAKENCERIAQKAEESVEEATEAKSSLDALMDRRILPPDLDAEAEVSEGSLVQQRSKALVVSKEMQSGLFDTLKEKTKSMYAKVKGAASDLMSKIAEKLKPILVASVSSILPKLEKEANSLLGKACSVADQRLEELQGKLQG